MLSDVAGPGCCSYGMKISACAGRAGPRVRTSLTMPTIVMGSSDVEPAADRAADRIDAGKRVLRQLLVDERDKRRVDAIAIGEIAAADDRHLQRLEVVRRRRR